MDGRVYTLEDEIDVIHEDLGRARHHLLSLERAELDGRVAVRDLYDQELAKTRARIASLERELAGAIADQIAAAEELECGGFQ